MVETNPRDWSFETKAVRAGYTPKKGEPVVPPINASVTYRYETTEQVHELFDLQSEGYFYSRIDNPTVAVVEKRVAELEGGVGALMTSSGQAANMFALLNICRTGDNIVAARSIYGGSVNLFQHRLKALGISVSFIDNDSSYDEVKAAITPETKAVFGETLSNPTLRMIDISEWARAAHDSGVPLIIDNTFATPFFCRPIEHGADIVTHSATKYLDGHALQVSGMIVDSGNFNWKKSYSDSGRFTELVEPDITYKGLSYTDHFGDSAYIVKARVQLMRDMGATPSPFSAFLLGNGVQTLPVRMERHFENALFVAKELEADPRVEKVYFPGLEGDRYHQLFEKYTPNGCAGVMGVVIAGETPELSRANAGKVINALKLVNIEVNVAEIRSCALHPATSTHRQMTEDELEAAGIEPGLLRISVGLENKYDIIADIKEALNISLGVL